MTEPETAVDTTALESVLSAALEVSVTGVEPLGDGLNLVLAISTASQGQYLLRRANPPRETICVNDVETEFEILRRLEPTRIPAPKPVLFSADESVVGGPFFVATHLDGETVPLGSDLPERFQTEAARARVADELVATLADVHAVDTEPFDGVCERYTPRELVERAVGQLDDATRVTGRDLPRLRAVGDWLLNHAPAPAEATLVHGDFRPGNVLFAEAADPHITGVLDWETAMLGDPLVELGYLLLRWRDAGDARPSLDGLEARYDDADALADIRRRNERGLAPFTAAPGSPTRREVVAQYEHRTGRTYEHDRFYRGYAAFVLAVVWEDLYRHRLAAGGAADGEPYVEYMSLFAEHIVDGRFDL
ncbi:phosphotransferase family protein [Halorarius litoreus]|uniref:phosphotransferase family protein n=1 Tax=Halorarius litoreus TaxID=2962676 RepID=UPI0020CD6BCD|nr:phosphotransferase family protein [Halorarius litoreus]